MPRTMARNTSQWAYQQQQQQPDYTPQTYGYQPHANYSANYGGNSSSGGGGGYQQHQQHHHSGSDRGASAAAASSSLYDPREVLSDAIATVVFMPTKFERTTYHLAEKFNMVIGDASTLANLVDSLVDQCLAETQFHSLAGRLCAYLALNVRLDFDGTSLKSLLVERCQRIAQQGNQLLQRQDGKKVRAFATIVSDLFLQMKASSPEDEADSSKRIPHDPLLADCVRDILTVLMTEGKTDNENLKVAGQKLKLCGKALEAQEKYSGLEGASLDEEAVWSQQGAPKMDAIIAMVDLLLNDTSLPEDVRSQFTFILETRSNERWATAEADNAKEAEEAAQKLLKPAPRKSAAIKIEPDPADRPKKPEQTITKVAPAPAQPPTGGTPAGSELTEEELRFMAEEGVEADGQSDLDDLESDGMTDDIVDAYEQFLEEQQQQQKQVNGK